MNFQEKRKNYLYLCLILFITSFINLLNLKANTKKSIYLEKSFNKEENPDMVQTKTAKKTSWEKLPISEKEKKNPIWKSLNKDFDLKTHIKLNKIKNKNYIHNVSLHSLNRSIVFSDKIVGPDISWIVPPGLKWNKKYKFDGSVRGHNRRVNGQSFFGWNGGDAVGQFYYQPFVKEKYSFGLNMGVRSVYKGNNAIGGQTNIGEGLSGGFRIDRKLSNTAGIAFGAEQLLHFDGLTDTGRDIYLTATKGWWTDNIEGVFPLNLATAGIGTGKLAEGNVKGLCSSLLGGSGTETAHQRNLCWAPIFSISRVFNEKVSTFLEYNSKDFILGTSIIPYSKVPLRGTFAMILADHIDNYKLHNFQELRWVFRLSLGF